MRDLSRDEGGALILRDFIRDTHPVNLRNIQNTLRTGGWHWLIPETVAETAVNRMLIIASITLFLTKKAAEEAGTSLSQ